MKKCAGCGKEQPYNKYNAESFSPEHCFKCRISSVRMGFTAGKSTFHGDTLVGGTIASDNRNTVDMARSQGHDPVPQKTAGGVGVSAKELNRLKSKSSFAGKKTVF
jgi:hypothetical protein